MTTIAANRKEMAGDTAVTGSRAKYYTDKVFRIGDNIVGVAGHVGATTKWLAWFRHECPPVEEVGFGDDEEMMALVLNADGLFIYTAMADPDKLHNKFFSIGSGSMSAMAAMRLGKSPREAVKIAHEFDENTGSAVTVLQVPKRTSKTKIKYQRSTKRAAKPPAAAPAVATDQPEAQSVKAD